MSNHRLINQSKGKAPSQDLSLNNENRGPKSKAIWDRTTTKLFIDACMEQVTKGERSERTLSKKGWRDAIDQFRTISGRNYDRVQLRNKWDSLRKEWIVWYNLFRNTTGLGWDNEKHTFIASSDWWDAKELVSIYCHCLNIF